MFYKTFMRNFMFRYTHPKDMGWQVPIMKHLNSFLENQSNIQVSMYLL